MDSPEGKKGGASVNKCLPSIEGKGDVVIDVDRDGGDGGVGDTDKEEKMCRVCHMTSDCTGDLIQLGCRCRNDLGTAHRCCAELWFATKGNRYCEICDAVARNVSGVRENGLMVEWIQTDAPRTYPYTPVERRYQPIYTFLVFIIIAALAVKWLLHEDDRRDLS